jgi:tetratricopeptide (TPR) repeat protein
VTEWRDDSAWQKRSREFVQLKVIAERRGAVPVMELLSPDEGTADTIEHWSRLPPHPNILELVSWSRNHAVVRYAALAWNRTGSNAQRTVANWGIQLVDVFALIHEHVSADLCGLFTTPLLRIDVGGHVRVALIPERSRQAQARQVAPELRKFPRCTESGMVYAIGQMLRGLYNVDDPMLETILLRATADNPRRRIKTLDELRAALRPMASKTPIRTDNELRAWTLFELGVGLLELGWLTSALERFETAMKIDDASVAHQAQEGREIARSLLEAQAKRASADAEPHEQIVPPGQTDVPEPRSVIVDWHAFGESRPPEARRATGPSKHQLEAEALGYEATRAFGDALNIYRRLGGGKTVFTSRARCHLALGEHGEAIDYAQRALAIESTHIEALMILTAAMLARGWHDEALRNAERLVDLQATGRAHYLRGKALFALGRMLDARDAFEQASQLDPKLLEAQLLRREVERVTNNVRATAGKQHAPTFDIPEQLAELRDVLISGDMTAAITALRDERFARDADAQLMLARFLAFDKRLDEAIAVYDALEATSHRVAALVGKATALLDLGRTGDALSIFEQLPDDADAAEGQARALAALGRHDDAAEAYRRFIALASSGSDLRVRAAQLALEQLAQRRRG